MKILIFGGDGMLGHQLLRQLQSRHDVTVTLRGERSSYESLGLYQKNAIGQMDVRSIDAIRRCLHSCMPQVVVNAVGLVKQRPSTDDCVENLEINALFPQQLACLSAELGARLIHFSTDCVFSGSKGNYTEADFPDAEDLYGQTKLLGETHQTHTLTLRTSIIGRELSRKASLVEWFLAQRNIVQGYTRAIYTGFTTLEMARIVEHIIMRHPNASGVWHVSSDKISKYDLLCLVKKHFKLDTGIVPSDSFVCDRSLCSDRFRAAFGYTPPGWDKMIEELAQDNDFYQ